ncbi:hypothetical protein ACFE04_008013 [Oxalis oulophora]
MTTTTTNNNNNSQANTILNPEIPIEIISEEEMALIDAALLAARTLTTTTTTIPSSMLSLSSPTRNAISVQSIVMLSKRGLSGCTSSSSQSDVEELGNLRMSQHNNNNNNNNNNNKKKKSRLADSLVNRFRRKSGLFVTDITASEWCEKQVDLLFQYGKPKATRAMKAGTARHAKLEQEVIQRVQVQIRSLEDKWAIKLMNFIVEGVWVVGVIDEIRMPIEETSRSPLLVDTKTRVRDTFPSEPQRRNGRLQLMCYKYLWDNLVAGNLQWTQFFDFFALDRYSPLSDEIIEMTANSGCPSKTLDDMVKYFRNACSMLPLADSELLLRYELQKDNSMIGEDKFTYNSDFLESQIHTSLEFWRGERQPSYAAVDERWKCRFCQFFSRCDLNPDSTTQSSPKKTNLDDTQG